MNPTSGSKVTVTPADADMRRSVIVKDACGKEIAATQKTDAAIPSPAQRRVTIEVLSRRLKGPPETRSQMWHRELITMTLCMDVANGITEGLRRHLLPNAT
jgi:hypothetical protein